MSDARQRAKEMLVHYLKRTEPEGFYNADTVAEMESIIDLIIEEAVLVCLRKLHFIFTGEDRP